MAPSGWDLHFCLDGKMIGRMTGCLKLKVRPVSRWGLDIPLTSRIQETLARNSSVLLLPRPESQNYTERFSNVSGHKRYVNVNINIKVLENALKNFMSTELFRNSVDSGADTSIGQTVRVTVPYMMVVMGRGRKVNTQPQFANLYFGVN